MTREAREATRAVKRELKQYSPEVRERGVRMVLELGGGHYPSRWAAEQSEAANR